MNKLLLSLSLSAISIACHAALPSTVQGIPYANGKAASRSGLLNPDPIDSENFDFNKIKFWAGDGHNQCAVVVQWNNSDEDNAIVFGYKWDGDATGTDAIVNVVKAHPQFYGAFTMNGTYGATINGLGWDPTGDGNFTLTFNSRIITPDADGIFSLSSSDCDSAVPSNTDDWFKGGWYEGYWSYWTKDSADGPMKYSQVGASGRNLTDGCIDGWMFAPGLQTSNWKPWVAAPLPETPSPIERIESNGVYFHITDFDRLTAEVTSPWLATQPAYKETITIPSSIEIGSKMYQVESIADGAFENCDISMISIPATIVRIGSKSLYTKALTQINMEGMTPPSCEDNTFYRDAWKTVLVVVPEESKDAYSDAPVWEDFLNYASAQTGTVFTGADGIRYMITSSNEEQNEVMVTFFSTASRPDEYYSNADHYNGDITVPENVQLGAQTYTVTAVGKNAFRRAKKMTSITLPSTIKNIGDDAFGDCHALVRANIPDGITTIPDGCFTMCKSLETVTGMRDVTSIGESGFMSCGNLKRVEGLSKVETVGEFAFASDAKLEDIAVMPALRTIGASAFNGCHLLKHVVLPVTIEENGICDIFGNNNTGGIVVYNCNTKPVEFRGIYAFGIFFSYEDDIKTEKFAPVYVPWGHRAAFLNDIYWRRSEIRQLTPIVNVGNDNVFIDGQNAEFSMTVDFDGEVKEKNVPELFLLHNNFGTFSEDCAKAMKLIYRQAGNPYNNEPIAVKVDTDGDMAYATITGMPPGEYEYHWECTLEGGEDLVTEWTTFSIQANTEASVDEIKIEDNTTPTEYYTIQGIRLKRCPDKGIFIEKHGDRVKKVIK